MNKIIILFLLLLIFSISPIEIRAASSENNDINYDEIQHTMDNILENHIDFEVYINDLITGKETFSIGNIFSKATKLIQFEMKGHLSTLGRLISIAIVSAIFTNLSLSFKNVQVSETGYYVIYLLLFSMLISTFVTASMVAKGALEAVLHFMKALIPTYFIAVGVASGASTSIVFYEMSLMLIGFAEALLVNIIIPVINVYLIIMLVNNLSKEDMLSKLASLLGTIVKWSLNSLLAAVIGFNTIQAMITPVIEKVKKNAVLKASESIPAIGDAIGGVVETMLGASILLKNAIGVAGMVVIVVIAAIPVIKLLIITLIYKGSGAILQPISDKRILECISASAEAASMLLHTLFIGIILFILTIAIVAISTM